MTKIRKPMVAGNWKMNGNNDSVMQLTKAVIEHINNDLSDKVNVVIAPSFIHISQVSAQLQQANSSVKLATQTISEHPQGAYTGEIAVDMLADFNCSYVILGHSERRQYHRETDSMILAKVEKVLSSTQDIILCIGETQEQRDSHQTNAVIEAQLSILKSLTEDQLKRITIAYEPVWAIGTGKTATPEMAQQVHAFIRQEIAKINSVISERVVILYGGSVKPSNAKELFVQEDIDGGLIGGAALDAAGFIDICKAAI